MNNDLWWILLYKLSKPIQTANKYNTNRPRSWHRIIQVNVGTKTAAYVDYVTTAGSIDNLLSWWQILCCIAPKCVYFP